VDASKVQRIVAKNLEEMRDGLGLVHWKVRIEVKSNSNEDQGTCRPMPGYNKATITIDNERHESEEEVLDTLRHELLHLYGAEMWLLWEMVESICGKETSDQLTPMFHHMAESLVRRLERVMP